MAATFGAKPARLPPPIGDGILAETSDAVVSVPEIFNYWLFVRSYRGLRQRAVDRAEEIPVDPRP
jgi:hypothetical protein